MSDSYVECLVKAKQPAWAKILKVLLVTLTVLSCLVMFVFIIFLPVALVAGVGAYFLNMFTDLEYEYLYLDKELSVDKIMAKSKRKQPGPHGSICTGLFLSSGRLQEPSGEGEGLQHRRGTSAGRSLCHVL
mgnify:CR=1 FL=1